MINDPDGRALRRYVTSFGCACPCGAADDSVDRGAISMKAKRLWRWLMAVAFVPFSMATTFGTSSCSFSGQGSGDLDDDGGVVIIDDD